MFSQLLGSMSPSLLTEVPGVASRRGPELSNNDVGIHGILSHWSLVDTIDYTFSALLEACEILETTFVGPSPTASQDRAVVATSASTAGTFMAFCPQPAHHGNMVADSD